MRCEDAIERIQTAAQPGADLSAAFEHAAGCDECQSALRAVEALRLLRHEPQPTADERAVVRAVDRALYEPARRYRRGFIRGAASGVALAAADVGSAHEPLELRVAAPAGFALDGVDVLR